MAKKPIRKKKLTHKQLKEKWFLWTMALGIYTLLTVFLWGEGPDLSFYKKINSDKFAAFGTMVASLLTAVTVYFLYKQNEHLAEERKAAIQPDLYITQKNFFSRDTETKMRAYPVFAEVNHAIAGEDLVYDSDMQFELHNIGLGHAKRIFWEFEFNVEEVRLFQGDTYREPHGRQSAGSFDFIGPNLSSKIFLGSNFTHSLGKSLEAKIQDDTVEKPQTTFTISYYDISNHYYVKKFTVSFTHIFRVHRHAISVMFFQQD